VRTVTEIVSVYQGCEHEDDVVFGSDLSSKARLGPS